MKSIEIKQITINVSNVKVSLGVFPEESMVRASVYYTDINKVDNVTIQGAEYDAWGSDDNYIYDLILSKLGLQKA